MRVACYVAGLIVAAVVVSVPAAEAAGDEARTGLSIATSPGGAIVYVDGEFAGQSPLITTQVTSGHHVVRVVKAGYLESARTITVTTSQPQVISVTLAPAAAAQGGVTGLAGADSPSNAWIDANFIAATSTASEQTVQFSRPLFGETLSGTAVYPELDRVNSFAVGGGARFGPGGLLGAGVRYSRFKHDDVVIGVSVTVPSPLVFNRNGSASGTTELEREDTILDLQAAFFVPTPGALSVRVFGGPTYFKLSEERVADIRYTQTFSVTTNVVTIDGAPFETVEESVWGFHVGADVAYFFSRNVGVGGTVSFSKGTATIADPFGGIDLDVERDLGKTLFGGGVRFRF